MSVLCESLISFIDSSSSSPNCVLTLLSFLVSGDVVCSPLGEDLTCSRVEVKFVGTIVPLSYDTLCFLRSILETSFRETLFSEAMCACRSTFLPVVSLGRRGSRGADVVLLFSASLSTLHGSDVVDTFSSTVVVVDSSFLSTALWSSR